ncbi:MAG: hypothetical protein WC758_01455 [Candidatus Woesearchaeota archaeon]|jgi:hypothetical protein
MIKYHTLSADEYADLDKETWKDDNDDSDDNEDRWEPDSDD